jgi:hypothetical protein
MIRSKTWVTINEEKSIHHHGVLEVNVKPKECFRAFAMITAPGDRLPLFMVAQGRTDCCHKQLKVLRETGIFHSESGWCNKYVKSEF